MKQKATRLQTLRRVPLSQPSPRGLSKADCDAWERAVAKRLRDVAGEHPLREIGALTRTNPETARRYLLQGRASARFLAAFCVAFEVSLEWMLLGRGSVDWRGAGEPPGAPLLLTALQEFREGHIEVRQLRCEPPDRPVTAATNGRRSHSRPGDHGSGNAAGSFASSLGSLATPSA
jgi:hypothetical protein